MALIGNLQKTFRRRKALKELKKQNQGVEWKGINNKKKKNRIAVLLETAGGTYLNSDPSATSQNTSSDDGTVSTWRSCPSLDPEGAFQSPLSPAKAEDEPFGLKMARSRQLPKTWYYSSIHVLVNQERVKRNIPALSRRRELDELARSIAEDMASNGNLEHSDPHRVHGTCIEACRIGENMARGSSIRDIHEGMMKNSQSDKNNILDRRYRFMGMGTALGSDEKLYMCQLFKSHSLTEYS